MAQAASWSFIFLMLSFAAPNALGVALFLPLTAILGGITLWQTWPEIMNRPEIKRRRGR